MKSNLACWQALQDGGYFENHPLYRGCHDVGHNDVEKIERFCRLDSSMVVVIVGCGYGREAAHIGRRVSLVYGIDVNEGILQKAVTYLSDHDVLNFHPVLAERTATDIPSGIDIVYSATVMQHLTRDLVHQYLQTLGPKLSCDGRMIIQFLQMDGGEADADVALYEPSVSWSIEQIAAAVEGAGLRVIEIATQGIRSDCVWHWAYIGKA